LFRRLLDAIRISGGMRPGELNENLELLGLDRGHVNAFLDRDIHVHVGDVVVDPDHPLKARIARHQLHPLHRHGALLLGHRRELVHHTHRLVDADVFRRAKVVRHMHETARRPVLPRRHPRHLVDRPRPHP
jgi:hypothetical protein